MSHPYKREAHKQDPKWLKNLNQYVEKATEADVTDTIRNYGGDSKTTAKAAYSPLEIGEDD